MKAAILTPVYLSVSWVLTVSYQLFTNTAVKTVASNLSTFWAYGSNQLLANLQTVSFVYAFSWIFVLSSVLPSLLLGRERSVLVQYLVCMSLTVLALSAQNLPWIQSHVQTVMGVSVFLESVLPATAYLLMPFILMVYLDVRSRRKRAKISEDHISIESGGKKYELAARPQSRLIFPSPYADTARMVKP
jgi:hypothetical protein